MTTRLFIVHETHSVSLEIVISLALITFYGIIFMWMQHYIQRAKTHQIARAFGCFFVYLLITIPLPSYENFAVVALFVFITCMLLLFQTWLLTMIGYERLLQLPPLSQITQSQSSSQQISSPVTSKTQTLIANKNHSFNF